MINKYKHPTSESTTMFKISKPLYETKEYGLLYPEGPKDSLDLEQFIDD
jgi:hypothetical protein